MCFEVALFEAETTVVASLVFFYLLPPLSSFLLLPPFFYVFVINKMEKEKRAPLTDRKEDRGCHGCAGSEFGREQLWRMVHHDQVSPVSKA